MKIKEIKWEEKKVDGTFFVNEKYISNILMIGNSELRFEIEYNVYSENETEYVLYCFNDCLEHTASSSFYNTLEEAKKGAEEYYINTMIELIQSLNENIDQFEDTDEDVINVLINTLKNATFK